MNPPRPELPRLVFCNNKNCRATYYARARSPMRCARCGSKKIEIKPERARR